MTRARTTFAIAAVWVLTLTVVPASAQIDLTGSYNSRMHEDFFIRGPGQDLGDYTGLALNDEARAVALSYEPSLLAMRERQCLPYSPYAFTIQPGGFSMWSESDADGRIIAWKTASQTIRMSLTIWMDGRPHPSPNVYSDFTGFTTGKWEGDTLTTYTTNLKTYTRRRGAGVPGSDRTTITGHFTRHDNLLTVTVIENDPIYLTEPNVVSRTWEVDPRGNIPPFTRCEAVTEIPRLEDSGIVPHTLPGQNAQEHFISTTYNIPQDAAMGHAETLYPEYRKTLRATYKAPTRCTRYCCGWLGFEGEPDSAPNLRCIIGGGTGEQDREILKSFQTEASQKK